MMPTEEAQEDAQIQKEHFENLREFYKNFTYSLQVFDPLDRPINNSEGEDQAIKYNELL